MNTFWAVTLVSGALLFIVLAFVTINRYIRYKERVALGAVGVLTRGPEPRSHGQETR
jgi:hypothetical protein